MRVGKHASEANVFGFHEPDIVDNSGDELEGCIQRLLPRRDPGSTIEVTGLSWPAKVSNGHHFA